MTLPARGFTHCCGGRVSPGEDGNEGPSGDQRKLGGEKGSWDAHRLLKSCSTDLQERWKTCPISTAYSSTKRNGKQIGTFEEAMLEESWQNLWGLQMASTADSLSPATDGCFTADSGRSSSTESLGSVCAGPHPLWQPHIFSGLQWSPLWLLAARCTFWNTIPAPHWVTLQYIGKQPLHHFLLLNQEILLLAERELQHHYYSCLLWKITSMLCTVCYRRSFFV